MRTSVSIPETFLANIETRLRIVWGDLFELTRAANIATQCERSLDSELYQEVMVSIHYRLVKLRFGSDITEELIRLGLLAFASHLFLQWRGVKIRFEHLAQRFANVLSLQSEAKSLPPQLALWVHTIGAIAVFNELEQVSWQPILTDLLRKMDLGSWNEVRACLKCILWVDTVQDTPAKRVVECALTQIE